MQQEDEREHMLHNIFQRISTVFYGIVYKCYKILVIDS